MALLACGGGSGGENEPAPRLAPGGPSPLQVYRGAGLLTGPDDFPAVLTFASFAGPADSTFVIAGLSLPASALRFRRDEDGFVARYVVSLRVLRDGQPEALIDRTETVRVGDFAETARTDESILFQAPLTLAPGAYGVRIRIRDGLSARGFEADDTLRVPAFGVLPHGSGATAGEPHRVAEEPSAVRPLTAPIPVYRGDLRAAVALPPTVILNPRHSVEYGGLPPRLYVESYDSAGVLVELRSDGDSLLWTRRVTLERGLGVAAGIVALPTDSLPLGRHWLVARSGGVPSERTPLLVSISDDWLAANFDEILSFLRYIAPREDVDALANASPGEGRERWAAFWADRDPVPATPVNELREDFFQRIRIASQTFGEAGRPGWLTDRGEVYIVLGPPSGFAETYVGPDRAVTGDPNAQQWVYETVPGGGRLSLLFVDRGGLGSYRLTPGSRSAFRAVAERIRRTGSRD